MFVCVCGGGDSHAQRLTFRRRWQGGLGGACIALVLGCRVLTLVPAFRSDCGGGSVEGGVHDLRKTFAGT